MIDEVSVAFHAKDPLFGTNIMVKDGIYSTNTVANIRCKDSKLEVELASVICEYLDNKAKQGRK